ncbi:MAG: S8 family serine peptidase [Bacteroidales bacterium]|jgi:hypothetical protein|nr:S8 family serine peptidase [Bacteroidales bacterium]
MYTKKIVLLLSTFLLWGAMLWGQQPAKYWVQFTDKNNSPYSINNPEEFLSPRAIENRQMYHIPCTEEDLPVNASYIKEVLSLDSGMRLYTSSKWLNGITVYSEKEGIEQAIRALPHVLFCEKTISLKEIEKPEKRMEMLVRVLGKRETPLTGAPCYMLHDLDYGNAREQIRLNNAHWLHRMGFRGEDVVIMVLDGGFLNADSLRHFQKLRDDGRLLGLRNMVSPGINPCRANTHGTMVLSCIASDVPGDLIGTAPAAQVYLCQTEDGCGENKIEEDNWVAGIEWADSLGCQVVNSSLGYTVFDDTIAQPRHYADLNGRVSRASIAASIAARKGLLICNSAGNSGAKKWRYTGAPAEANDIISVGAVDSAGTKAPFSSFGPTADGRVKPEACAVGYRTYIAHPRGTTTRANGTSFAAPLLSGMVACLRQAFPEVPTPKIREAICLSGSQAQTPDSALGYGITDFLKTYNLLKSNHDIVDENGNEYLHFSFPRYQVGQKQKLPIHLFAKRNTSITMRARLKLPEQQSNQKPKNKWISKTFSAEQGNNEFFMPMPNLLKNMNFGIIELEISGEGFQKYFIIGKE